MHTTTTMGRGGRQSGMTTATLAAAAVLALATRQAVTASPECAAMDLVTYNVSDYIRWSGTSDRL